MLRAGKWIKLDWWVAVATALVILCVAYAAFAGNGTDGGGYGSIGGGLSGTCICGDGSRVIISGSNAGTIINNVGATTGPGYTQNGGAGGAVSGSTGQVNGGGTGSASGGLTAGGPR